jgi:hypothetical protein
MDAQADFLTTSEFRTRSIDCWFYQIGAGQALVLGPAIIAQNINMSVDALCGWRLAMVLVHCQKLPSTTSIS